MRWLILMGMLLPVTPAAAQSRMTCSRLPVSPAVVHADGWAELVSDVLLSCSGGSPTAAGASLPQLEILLISNTPTGNRTFVPPAPTSTDPIPPASTTNGLPWNDALLLVDDPAPGSQTPCTPAAGADSCPALAGSSAPNVFQGRQLQDNTILFRHIPIDPPGDGATRLIRIANVRVAVPLIPSLPVAGQMTSTVQIFNSSGDAVAVQNPDMPGANAVPGYLFAVRTASDGAVSSVSPALTTTPSLLSTSTAQSVSRFNVKFSEGFPDAFRRRNLGTSGSDPLYIVSQAVPGASFHTESGFLNGTFPQTNSMNQAGLADSGTRLKVVFENVPDNVSISVSTRDAAAGTTGYSGIAPKALLTSTDVSGGGLFNLSQSFSGDGLYQLTVQNGTAMAVWEVVSSDPAVTEDISFSVVLVAGPNHAAALGIATARGVVAPVSTNTAPTTTPDAPLPLPRFREIVTADSRLPAFQISPTLATTPMSSVSAASYSGSVSPDSLVATFATGVPAQPPGSIAGVGVDVIDNAGVKRSQQIVSVPANQVSFVLDQNTATGLAVVNLNLAGRLFASGLLQVDAIAPALFSADGSGHGPAVGDITRVGNSGNQTTNLAAYDSNSGTWSTVPVDLGQDGDLNILTLYGTGARHRSSVANVSLTVGGVTLPILFAGPQNSLAGVDLVSAGPLPLSLRGAGEVAAVLTIDGKVANRVTLRFK
jgi:uncharacterized protein (TIGR03437 family)